ncbi:MAG: glycosyltransferase family 2 protein [Patescibacteria group bacterium]|nr:MAG: glycosyltransferase family 2 protein [Patescibacteria group bacterium]
MARISVHIVAWNHARVLRDAVESLRAQTFKDFTLTVVDNASSDGSVDVVRAGFPEATVLRNFKNLGFSHAHNQAVELARNRWADDDKKGRSSIDRYVLVMNPDIILQPDFLERLAGAIDGRFEIGSACGKLLKVYPRLEDEDEPRRSEMLDSAGLRMRRDRRAADRGAGEHDGPAYAAPVEVFGPSGALALYRAEAVEALREADGEFYDEDLFAYKEDVDAAWRLRLLGWKSLYVPDATAYHYRGTGGSEKAGVIELFKRRLGRSALVNRLSTRNHLLVLAKNDDWTNRLLHLPWILVHEIGKFLSTLVLAPRTLGAYFEALALLPKMWRKRGRLRKSRKASPKEIRTWFR